VLSKNVEGIADKLAAGAKKEKAVEGKPTTNRRVTQCNKKTENAVRCTQQWSRNEFVTHCFFC
jgi:hypothetical protein